MNEFEELQKEFNRLCDEQEQLSTGGFAKVFEVLDSLEESFTPQHPYTESEDNINKALELTGHSTDEDFCKAFKRNNQIIIRGKQIQRKILEKLPKPQGVNLTMITGADIENLQIQGIPKQTTNNEWLFYPMSIIAPQSLMEVLNEIIKRDGEQGKGLFANHTNIPEEDEQEDEFLLIDAFGLKCSLVPYWDELKHYNIIGDSGFFKDDFRKVLLVSLKNEISFIREHTDKPGKVKNHIITIIKEFDEMPVWGLFFQILILQGLCRWLEEIPLNECDNGYKEAQSLYNWLINRLLEKLSYFCFMPFGNEDKQILKPLCEYLYSTEVGQAIQKRLSHKLQKEQNPQTGNCNKTAITLPIELDTDKAKVLFQQIIALGYCISDGNLYRWTGTPSLFGYFVDVVSDFLNVRPSNGRLPWKLFKPVFQCSETDLATAKQAVNDYKNKNQSEPEGFLSIKNICK